ncbi:MAG: hypothetical protein J6Q27_00890 [Clostridia bacterium]|nr:hypothetical protein [Clostridia bacterium]
MSERRELASFPKIAKETLADGSFAENFETYATERFPYRDLLRSLKANFDFKVLNKLDNNGIFVADGHISKIEDTENPKMMDHAAERFLFLYDSFIKDKNAKVYFSIIPDKNYFLAEKNGYPSLDYPSFVEKMKEKTPFMQYIDVTDKLSLADYYTTDTHWRQEEIIDVAEKFASKMHIDIGAQYRQNQLEKPFYGVYSGQLAMDFEPDELCYLTNATIDNCIVTYYDTGMPKKGEMYNMEKANGKDPYEIFLSGTTPLVTIENKTANTDRELVLFRDSFGSSLAPLFAQGYQKITVVDIRYIQSAYVGNFVDFQNADVLFVYSATLLNNSLAMK